MRALLSALLLWLSLSSATAQGVIPLPQPEVVPDFVTGLNENGELTKRPVDFVDLSFQGLFGAKTTSTTSADVALGNYSVVLDDCTGFNVDYTVQMRTPDDPINYMYGVITALDSSSGACSITIAVVIAQGGGTYESWVLQVIAGPFQGIPASAGMTVSADSFAVPDRGDTVSLTVGVGKAFEAGDTAFVAALEDIGIGNSYFIGTVISYDSSTGAMDLFVRRFGGSGTFGVWSVALTDTAGADAALITYSTTSFAMAKGDKTFTVQSGKFFPVGSSVFGTALADPTEHFAGIVSAYSGASLTIMVVYTTSTNTFAAWQILDTSGLVISPQIVATSTTSNTIASATTKTFTVQSGKFLPINSLIIIYDASNSANYMLAQVTNYSGTTLDVFSISSGGSGTIANWFIQNLTGPLGTPTGGIFAYFDAFILGTPIASRGITFSVNPLSAPGDIVWEVAPGGIDVNLQGDLLWPDPSAASPGDILTLDGSNEPQWVTPSYYTSPTTTAGDIIYNNTGTAGGDTRLGIGTANQVLRTNTGATAPTWGNQWVTVVAAGTSLGTGTNVVIALPAGYSDAVVTFSGLSFNNASRRPLIQVSTDNGSTYDTTAGNYPAGQVNYTGGALAVSSVASLMQTETLTAAQTVSGSTTLQGYGTGLARKPFQSNSLSSVPSQRSYSGEYIGSSSAVTHIRIISDDATAVFDAGTYSAAVK